MTSLLLLISVLWVRHSALFWHRWNRVTVNKILWYFYLWLYQSIRHVKYTRSGEFIKLLVQDYTGKLFCSFLCYVTVLCMCVHNTKLNHHRKLDILFNTAIWPICVAVVPVCPCFNKLGTFALYMESIAAVGIQKCWFICLVYIHLRSQHC